jgi:hypothetical protein
MVFPYAYLYNGHVPSIAYLIIDSDHSHKNKRRLLQLRRKYRFFHYLSSADPPPFVIVKDAACDRCHFVLRMKVVCASISVLRACWVEIDVRPLHFQTPQISYQGMDQRRRIVGPRS